MARFPHFKGARGKKRPVVVVQADHYNALVRSVIVAEVTSNLTLAGDPAYIEIDLSTPDGQATGLKQSSMVSCLHLATLDPILINRVIGGLSGALQNKLDACLKVALGIP